MWLVFFAVPLTVLAAIPFWAPLRFPVMDTILSWFRSLKDREPAPPKFCVLTLTPAATDTMLVCTLASPFTVSATMFWLFFISELNLLVTLPTVMAAPAAVLLPPDTSTAMLTISLPATALLAFFVSALRYFSPVGSILRSSRYCLYLFFSLLSVLPDCSSVTSFLVLISWLVTDTSPVALISVVPLIYP